MSITEVSGYEAFRKTVENLSKDPTEPVNVYFTGEKDATGKSWCPDCNQAEPLVMKALAQHGKNTKMLIVDVGNRDFWKDIQNPFRKDPNAPVHEIPTLIRWKTPARLNGDQCSKTSLLEMFFTEETD